MQDGAYHRESANWRTSQVDEPKTAVEAGRETTVVGRRLIEDRDVAIPTQFSDDQPPDILRVRTGNEASETTDRQQPQRAWVKLDEGARPC